jgi:hypothetical protein
MLHNHAAEQRHSPYVRLEFPSNIVHSKLDVGDSEARWSVMYLDVTLWWGKGFVLGAGNEVGRVPK